jgi:C4-type Zn-finger protein
MAITTEEKAFRQFLRSTFKARMACDESGNNITSLKGKTAKAQIRNVDTVLENLRAKAKVLKETNRSVTFAYQQGKKGPSAEITVSLADDRTLTMVSKH